MSTPGSSGECRSEYVSADSTYYGTAKPSLTQFSLHYRFRFRFSAGCSTLFSTRNSSLSTLRSLSSVPHPYPPFFAFSPYVFTPHRRGSAPFWGHLCGCTSPSTLHSPLSILHSLPSVFPYPHFVAEAVPHFRFREHLCSTT